MKYFLIVILLMIFLLIRLSKAQTWVQQNSGVSTGYFNDVQFVNSNTGWVCGPVGMIKTVNGGSSWISQTLPPLSYPVALFFADASTGFACGFFGKIIKTTNGGSDWIALGSGTTQDLTTIFFLDANTGYAGGNNGTIVKTTNAGANWVVLASVGSISVYSLFFTDADTGYFCNNFGHLRKTTNGGTSWISQVSTPPGLTSVFFLNANTGYSSGLSGRILKTTNAGSNWISLNSGGEYQFMSISFTDGFTGYVCGDNGTLLKTTDAGLSWFSQSSGVSNSLFAFYFLNQSTGYCVGENGTILKTTDQPLPVELSYFNSQVKNNEVCLRWGCDWELNNSGFEIERKTLGQTGTGEWNKEAFVSGAGTTNTHTEYSFIDRKLQTGKYNYRLKQIDHNGNFEYHNLNEEVIIKAPSDFQVSQNYPNPSNPKSKIDLNLPIDGMLEIKMYDMLGREVLAVVNENKSAGFYSFELDGSGLSSGVYFYRVSIDGNETKYSDIKKMILVK